MMEQLQRSERIEKRREEKGFSLLVGGFGEIHYHMFVLCYKK